MRRMGTVQARKKSRGSSSKVTCLPAMVCIKRQLTNISALLMLFHITSKLTRRFATCTPRVAISQKLRTNV